MTPVGTSASRAPRPISPGKAAPQPNVELAVVNKNRAIRVNERRRVRRLIALSGGIVVTALFAVAGAQALVASEQLRIDKVDQSLSTVVAANENLQLRRAQLAAPARILQIAQTKLHMIIPAEVNYLNPVDPGPAVSSKVPYPGT